MLLEALLLFKIEQPEDQEIELAVKYSCCNQFVVLTPGDLAFAADWV